MIPLYFVLFLLVFGYLTFAWFRHTKDLPPGPYGIPIFGYLPWLAGRHPHLKFTALAAKYGPIYSLRMGSVFTVVLSDPRLIRQAFSLDEFSGRAPLFLTHGIMKGNGIICAEGEKWKETRRFVSSTLRNLGMVKVGHGRVQMEKDIMRGVQEVVAKMNNLHKENPFLPFDLSPVLIHALGNVLFRLVFGKDWSEDDKTWKFLQHLQEEGTKLIGVSAAINFLPFLRFLPNYKNSRKFIEEGIEYTHEIYQSLLNDHLSHEGNSPSKPMHVMGAFSEEMRRRGENGYFDRTQFNYLMADIFGAGVDTTLATLRWFLLYMALTPQWQEQVREEIFAATEGRDLTLDHMDMTPILEACIMETQRIRPVTPVGIPHGTTKETRFGGFRIPAGSMIIPLQWAVHMSPSYDKPHVFNPARFIAADGSLLKLEHFIPFQTGKRMCVGMEYAKVVLFLFGGNIIKNFSLSLPEGLILDLNGEPGITLTPSSHQMMVSPTRAS